MEDIEFENFKKQWEGTLEFCKEILLVIQIKLKLIKFRPTAIQWAKGGHI